MLVGFSRMFFDEVVKKGRPAFPDFLGRDLQHSREDSPDLSFREFPGNGEVEANPLGVIKGSR